MVSNKNSTYHKPPHIKVNSPRNYTFSGRAAAGAFGGRDGDVPVRECLFFFDLTFFGHRGKGFYTKRDLRKNFEKLLILYTVLIY